MENPTDNKYKLVGGQFLKFALVGLLNTGVDFGILNILSKVTGITSGNGLIPLNAISFAIATANSYYLNKKWSFRDDSVSESGKKFSKFLIISIVGVTINTIVVRLVTDIDINQNFGIGDQLWLNIAKAVATGVSLVWNFIGYKFFVFKK